MAEVFTKSEGKKYRVLFEQVGRHARGTVHTAEQLNSDEYGVVRTDARGKAIPAQIDHLIGIKAIEPVAEV